MNNHNLMIQLNIQALNGGFFFPADVINILSDTDT